MPDIIRCKIDVLKIQKEYLYAAKSGAKYLDITLLPSKNSPYGDDYMIIQDLGKDARARGERGKILGNGKFFFPKGKPNPPAADREPEQTRVPTRPPAQSPMDDTDEPPF